MNRININGNENKTYSWPHKIHESITGSSFLWLMEYNKLNISESSVGNRSVFIVAKKHNLRVCFDIVPCTFPHKVDNADHAYPSSACNKHKKRQLFPVISHKITRISACGCGCSLSSNRSVNISSNIYVYCSTSLRSMSVILHCTIFTKSQNLIKCSILRTQVNPQTSISLVFWRHEQGRAKRVSIPNLLKEMWKITLQHFM